MRAATQKIREEGVIQETALVVGEAPLRLRAEGVDYDAERAASCLLAPKQGDEVLVALLPDRRAYVLAVLEREEGSGTEICVEGDLRLRSETGRVELSSAEGVSVVTPRDITMIAGSLSVRAVATALASEAITLVSKTVACELDRVRLAARTFDAVLDRFTQRAKQSIRVIEESEHLRAGRIDYVADKSVTLHAENTIVTAKELVKVDGAQIQLG
jgi:Protein of unknown function (DUF3540)